MPFVAVVMMFACLMLGIAVLEKTNKDELDRFITRCGEKGGLVLQGARHGSHNWYGCYKGVIEIENEEG